jgi:hypothetical protein
MKQYPLTETELTSLGNTSAASTFCFWLGGALVGFGISLHKDLAFAQGVPSGTSSLADTVKLICLVGGGCFLIAGAALFLYGRRTLDEIKAQTIFTGSPTHLMPEWPAIMLRISGWVLLLGAGVAIGIFFR